MASDPNDKIEKNQVEARQGTRSPKMVYYLAGSIALVIVLFFIVWLTTRGGHAPT